LTVSRSPLRRHVLGCVLVLKFLGCRAAFSFRVRVLCTFSAAFPPVRVGKPFSHGTVVVRQKRIGLGTCRVMFFRFVFVVHSPRFTLNSQKQSSSLYPAGHVNFSRSWVTIAMYFRNGDWGKFYFFQDSPTRTTPLLSPDPPLWFQIFSPLPLVGFDLWNDFLPCVRGA